MLIQITDLSELTESQQLFQEFLYEHLSNIVPHKFGHLGANFDEFVHTNGKLWYFTKLADEPQPN